MFLLLAMACAGLHGAADHLSTEEALPWDVHPRVVTGDIRVAPPVVIAPPQQANLIDFMGNDLGPHHANARAERARELNDLPEAVHAAVPGALFAAMPPGWSGTFRDARLPPTTMHSLERAVSGDASLPEALAAAARLTGGEATLFTWVVAVDGAPLTASHLVGEMLIVDGVPVVVDYRNEPYQVEARVGVALVARDGELLFRYEDDYEGLLSAHSDLRWLGRSVAHALVGDIAPMWLEAYPSTEPSMADAWSL
ncbi:MAG: hypothetical protein H6740_14100 [Alphaproteobacteria bacterium]|nr:hypothetical protein [Alphaproteobacteria bacterium]